MKEMKNTLFIYVYEKINFINRLAAIDIQRSSADICQTTGWWALQD